MVLNKEQMEQIRKDFGMHSNDTGSTAVQIATLTGRITLLTGHLQRNKKDFSCKRTLLMLIAQRRSLGKYLQRTNEPSYKDVIGRLGLKK
ncbi:MAG TPA: 30S ribosomal protein S15 [Candidatus Babeliales bacterium]|nr:30S ribosomal protein S15 [Candidatus Babeliales bacterium]